MVERRQGKGRILPQRGIEVCHGLPVSPAPVRDLPWRYSAMAADDESSPSMVAAPDLAREELGGNPIHQGRQ